MWHLKNDIKRSVSIVFLLVTVVTFSSYAQETRKAKDTLFHRNVYNMFLGRTPFDTNYIANYSYKFIGRLYGIDKISITHLTYTGLNHKHDLSISSNRRTNVGVGFNYLWLGINLGFNFPFINNDDNLYGETKRMDAQLYIYGRINIIEGYVTYYKGMYIEDSDLIASTLGLGTVCLYFPDLRQITVGGSYTYVFNPSRFSYKAAFIQSDVQKKSAGSLLLGANVDYYNVRNLSKNVMYKGEEFLTPILRYKLVSLLNLNFSIVSLGIKTGYAYSLVVKKVFFASGSIEPGLNFGLQMTDEELSEKRVMDVLIPEVTFRFSVGYNGPKYFAALNYVASIDWTSSEYQLRQYKYGFLRLSAGVRLNWFSKKAKQVEEIMNR